MIPIFSTLITILSILSESEEQKYHVIFRWDDGIELVRPIPPYPTESLFWGHGSESPVIVFRSSVDGKSSIFVLKPMFHSMYPEYQNTEGNIRYKCRGKIAWLSREYLHYNVDPFFNSFEPIPPIEVDTYEMTIYETGQMNKSLLLMNNDDFMATVRQ